MPFKVYHTFAVQKRFDGTGSVGGSWPLDAGLVVSTQHRVL